MQLATWNVNSLKVRLPQVLDWLAANPVDVLCLQELKQEDHAFPLAELAAAGYRAEFAGQKTYNGVAIVYRDTLTACEVIKDIPGYDDPQRRVIAASFGELRVVCAYFVNGEAVGSDKYAYKLEWLGKLAKKHGIILIVDNCFATDRGVRCTNICTIYHNISLVLARVVENK